MFGNRRANENVLPDSLHLKTYHETGTDDCLSGTAKVMLGGPVTVFVCRFLVFRNESSRCHGQPTCLF